MARWVKGIPSPNPGGRPKSKPYATSAREILAAPGGKPDWGPRSSWSGSQIRALGDYESWGKGDPQAATRLLDRAEGKPASSLEVSGALGLRRLPDGIEQEAALAI